MDTNIWPFRGHPTFSMYSLMNKTVIGVGEGMERRIGHDYTIVNV